MNGSAANSATRREFIVGAGQLAGASVLTGVPLPPVQAAGNSVPFTVSDYDGGNVFWVRDGEKQPQHGMREAWVFNRAMTWLDDNDGVEGGVICYTARGALALTGRKSCTRWFTSPANELTEVDDQVLRFTKGDPKTTWDHALLPPLQFLIEQHPVARLTVSHASRPWQLVVLVKGRSGPPLYASPWQNGSGSMNVDLLKLYRDRGYSQHFAELEFAMFTRTRDPGESASVEFRLWLEGAAAVVPSLPVIRTADRAQHEGVPIYAIVLDENARRLGKEDVAVNAHVGDQTLELSECRSGLWKGLVRNLRLGEHDGVLHARRKAGGAPLSSRLSLRITDGQFVGYDPVLRLLTRAGQPIGPITGSARIAPMFKYIGTAREAPVRSQQEWDAVKGERHEGQYFNHGGPNYGFHFWESFTERELEADYAYLGRCGYTVVHLCQGIWVWERLDAGGRIAPHGAEQLALLIAAANRHGIRLHLALSHYPLGRETPHYAQYLEAGYQPSDYARTDSSFYKLFNGYLAQFATLFRDDTAISSYTAAGEGDVACGKTFVNAVYDYMRVHDPNHLFVCEPHLNPKPFPRDANYYRKDGWRPLLGGMRTYMIDSLSPEHIGVQLKIGAMGDVFLAEGVFWAYLDAPHKTDAYRTRVRQEFYTGLAYRSPIQMSWDERLTEDERMVFEQVRRAVDWSKPFAPPRLVLRIGSDLGVLPRYEKALSHLPLEYVFILKDDPVPAGALFTLDTEGEFKAPAFRSAGGLIPDELKKDIPLRLPENFVANHSWSRDRTLLLAYMQRQDDVEAKDKRPEIVLQNFPAGPLPFRLYDLETKRVALAGRLEKQHRIPIPQSARHLFLLVGQRE